MHSAANAAKMHATTSITIRNVSKEAHAELQARAALNGQSLQEYLRLQLEALASKPDMKTLLAQIQERVRRTGTNISTQTILDDLDAIRRDDPGR